MLRFSALFLIFSALSAFAQAWKPFTDAERSATAPKVDKNADAEMMFWDVFVTDEIDGPERGAHVTTNYKRIKVYNDRGAEAQAKVTIPFSRVRRSSIADVKGRTIKPDGTIIELKGDQIFENVVAKFGKSTKVKAKTFSLPGVVPGAIIEYSWREVLSEYIPSYVTQNLQNDIPTWEVNYYVVPRPAEMLSEGERMFYYVFNGSSPGFQQVRYGSKIWNKTTFNNIPAFKDEPDTPADEELKMWSLLYYTANSQKDMKKYWLDLARNMAGDFNKRAKVSGDVKSLAAAAVEGAATPAEKLAKIADYCRTQIKNIFYETAGITAEDRDKYKPKAGLTAADTAKSKIGLPSDINALFAAMAQSQGFEVRGVQATSADYAGFRQDLLDPFLMRNELVAVKVGTEWRYFDVGDPYVASGMVGWDAEGQFALLLDTKDPQFGQVMSSTPEQSTASRDAKLKLNEDGSLEGTITVTYNGHGGVNWKKTLESLSEAKQQEEIKAMLKGLHGDAEATDIKIMNVTDPRRPFSYSYAIKIGAYGQRTGKRVFFQPGFFQHGTAPRFPATERNYPVRFRYPYVEDDTVEIALPAGYKLENPEAPAGFKLGDIGELTMDTRTNPEGTTVVQRRKLTWGNKNTLLFTKENYPGLKQAWDAVYRADQYSMTARQQ